MAHDCKGRKIEVGNRVHLIAHVVEATHGIHEVKIRLKGGSRIIVLGDDLEIGPPPAPGGPSDPPPDPNPGG